MYVACRGLPPVRGRPSRSTAYRQLYAGCDGGADESDAEPERAEGAPPRSRPAAATKSMGAAAAGRKRATSKGNARKTAVTSKVSRKSGGAAAASSAVAEAAAKPTEFTIRWWDFIADTSADAIRPNDPHYLNMAMQAAATDDAPLSAAGSIKAAATTLRSGRFARLPLAAIEHWRTIKYAAAGSELEDTIVQREELIWWDSKRSILTGAARLQHKVWTKIVIDLCEPNDVENQQDAV